MFTIGDLIKSRLSSELVSIWATPGYDTHIDEFGPDHIGIIVEQDEDRRCFRILVNGKCGWIFETFLERLS